MALIVCPDCAREISDSANACPGCGRPIALQLAMPLPTPPKSNALTVVLAVVGSIVGIVIVASAVVAFAVKKHSSGTKDAGLACSIIRDSTTLFMSSTVDAECPTVNQLKQARFLALDFSAKDPWGGTYKIVCTADDVTVRSGGPDGLMGTDDDVVFPPPGR